MKVTRDGTEIWWGCPGCEMSHSIPVTRTGEEAKRNWTFNGDVDNPTITPSILASYGYRDKKPTKFCHFYIREGSIEFLADCTHKLAGKIVPMEIISPST
jgi:hypothetical protein